MIADVLVHVDSTLAGKRRISYALALAERHHARLTGLHVTPPADIPPYYKPSKVEHALEKTERDAAHDARASESLFGSVTSKSSVPVVWSALKGGMSDQICELAQCTDIVVLGQYEREGAAEHHPLSLAEAVAIDCGRPVLVVPADVDTREMRRALIAWDGGREAVRAVHDALPILRQSKAVVEIACIDEGEPKGSLQSLIDHLERHRIAVGGNVHLHAIDSAASALIDRLRTGHFGLLIMGAYGHPAWLEFLFGGTTSSALTNASVPVLVSR